MASSFAPFRNTKRPLPFHTLGLSPALRALVLAPHPDDFDDVAITLRTLRDNGNPIELAVLTSGASGVEDGFAPDLTRERKGEIREQEQRASCRFFGLPEARLSFLRLAEDAAGHLEDTEANFHRLLAYWEAHPADLVFLPHGNDTNACHRRTYALFRRLVAAAPRPTVALLNRDPKTREIREDVATWFGAADADWKAALLQFHQTQHQRNLRTRGHGLDRRILDVNRQAAAALGGEAGFAETFELECFEPVRSDSAATPAERTDPLARIP